ncbi:MAG: polyprenyl synthetase family protein [Deltaproteobacteria bacterium]|nr:polyprenyl synthetase family protein [Deltaproteobacteria bacterium]
MSVFEEIRCFIQKKISNPVSLSLLLEQLDKTRRMIADGYWIPAFDLPEQIGLNLNQPQRESRLLTRICAFIYLGADLLDDLHDGELQLPQNISTAEVTLLSATLLTAFPSMTLSELHVNAETKVKMQETIAQSLLKMSLGQQQDISTVAREDISLDEVKQSVMAKSGEELALFCLLAAQYSELPLPQQKYHENFGRLLGTALQMASDYHDLMWAPVSCDLKRGTRSLPIAFCLEKLRAKPRREFMKLLEEAADNAEKLQLFRHFLADSGSLDYLALLVEDCCLESLKMLELLNLGKETKMRLKTRIESVSLLATRKDRAERPMLFGM